MTLKLNNITHIIWDWNGTLLNDVGLAIDSMNQILSNRNMPIMSEEYYKSIFDFPVESYYAKLGFDFKKEPFKVVGLEFIERYNQGSLNCKLNDGVLDIVKGFQNKGYIQSVLSARNQDVLRQEISFYGLNSYMAEVYGLNNHYAAGKSELGIELIRKLQVEPQNVLFVGDTTHDFDVADKLGCQCVLVAGGHQSYEKLVNRSSIILNSMDELLDFIS